MSSPMIHRFWWCTCVLPLIFLTCLEIKFGKHWCTPDNSPLKVRDHGDELREKQLQIRKLKTKIFQFREILRKTFPFHAKIIEKDILPNYPWIFIITPTYTREVQKAELTRLGNTLLGVPKLHWIVVEDSSSKTALVTNYLAGCGLSFTHLYVSSPPGTRTEDNVPDKKRHRGLLQRNKALEWIRNNLDSTTDKGVVFFGDDDNTYDLQLFEEMRFTKKVSVWPVGLISQRRFQTPILRDGRVAGYFSWNPRRPFAVDMAGFALNIRLLFEYPKVEFDLDMPNGHQETRLLQMLVSRRDLEPKADNCTKILVWHTRTEKVSLKDELKIRKGPWIPALEV